MALALSPSMHVLSRMFKTIVTSIFWWRSALVACLASVAVIKGGGEKVPPGSIESVNSRQK